MAYKNDRTKNRRRYRSRYRSAHNYKQKRSSAQTKAAVLVSVLTFVVIASLVIVFTFGDSIYTLLDNALSQATQATEPVTEEVTQPPTEATQPPTEVETEPPVEQEEQYLELLELCGYDESVVKVNQMVFVVGNESDLTCKMYCYEKNDEGVFEQKIGPFDGYIGSGGIDRAVTPYESKTPVGLFKIEYSFGTLPDPGTPLEYTQFTTNDYWVTDPASVNYNRWMYGTENQDWSTAQWLYEYTLSYPHAVVFDYNRSPVDPAQGCAKFIHVSYGPTSNGGVGLSQGDITTLLYWLNPSSKPYVAICKE